VREAWVVEDNDQNFELVDFLLGEAGWSVRRASDGAGFVRLLAGAPPDLVLLDMHLPDVAGLDLLARLRADRRFAGVPVIALTAHAMRGDREKFLAAGCDGYLSKPIETSTFVAAVEASLERGR
jgi:two-component system cell cycle response regulator DivK